jgi:cholestenol Delta-isomerase
MYGQISQPSTASHPYYPLGIDIPHYVANDTPVPILLASLAGMLGSVLLAARTLALRFNPGLTMGQLLVVCWFVLCKFFF